MEERSNTRAHLRMDVAILMQYRKLTPSEYEDIETIMSNKEDTDLSPLSFSLRPFMEGEGKEEELGNIDPFILNALIDINLKLNLIITTMSSGGQKNILTRMPIEANLSEGGIGFTAVEEVREGDLFEIEMILPVFPIAVIKTIGKAVRVNPLQEGGYNIGVQYTYIKDEDRDKIVHYLFKKQREWLRVNKVKTG
ncbi:MAG: PilZ domain-containing protein [Thermodesulfobacteriota bacterium]|nr:PilZ domain-containing protein [Thermodesulfobacteriota bacterium]